MRRVDFCASERPAGCVGSSVGSGHGGAPAPGSGDPYTGPCSLYFNRGNGSLTGACDISNVDTADRSVVTTGEEGYPRGLLSADSSEGFAGGDPDID